MYIYIYIKYILFLGDFQPNYQINSSVVLVSKTRSRILFLQRFLRHLFSLHTGLPICLWLEVEGQIHTFCLNLSKTWNIITQCSITNRQKLFPYSLKNYVIFQVYNQVNKRLIIKYINNTALTIVDFSTHLLKDLILEVYSSQVTARLIK